MSKSEIINKNYMINKSFLKVKSLKTNIIKNVNFNEIKRGTTYAYAKKKNFLGGLWKRLVFYKKAYEEAEKGNLELIKKINYEQLLMDITGELSIEHFFSKYQIDKSHLDLKYQSCKALRHEVISIYLTKTKYLYTHFNIAPTMIKGKVDISKTMKNLKEIARKKLDEKDLDVECLDAYKR